jgi:aryl-alcohol dehydrogenase-like predicted oxidoreductase
MDAARYGVAAQRRDINMQYKHLGRTGLLVSRLALGAMNFGYVTDEATSFKIMDSALDRGINFIDTADVYGGPQAPDMQRGFGLSEEIIGRWLHEGSGRRDRLVLATKVYQPMGLGPNDRRLSAYHIRKACEDSLRRLQTDHIDLYQMHHVDRSTPWEEIWQAMEQLVREGKVIYVGSSNFAGWDIATAQSIASSRGFLGLASEQSLYNLSARTVELEVIPALRYHGIGLIPWSPLGGGLLGGVLQKAANGRRAAPQVQEQVERHRSQLEPYEALCSGLGEQPADVALAWLLHNPVVTAAIIGPRVAEQLSGSQRALEISLPEETLRNLDEIWPGPGGEAPQAYAW